MRDSECSEFLAWVLPRLEMCRKGFRKVRGQICKRLQRRLKELGIEGFESYRSFLAANREEWNYLPSLLRITISRFYRDRDVFEALKNQVLPDLITRTGRNGSGVLRCWSAGCASGEEVYTLKIIEREYGNIGLPPVRMEIVATDIDLTMLDRARQGFYSKTSLKELPAGRLEDSFDVEGDRFRVKSALRSDIQWLRQDIREKVPPNHFDLVLCRNLVFTYFDITLQRRIMDRLASVVRKGGVLIVGKHESLPAGASCFSPWIERLRIYKRVPR